MLKPTCPMISIDLRRRHKHVQQHHMRSRPAMPRIDQNIFRVDVPQDKVLLWQVFSDGGKLRSHLSLGGGPGFMKHIDYDESNVGYSRSGTTIRGNSYIIVYLRMRGNPWTHLILSLRAWKTLIDWLHLVESNNGHRNASKARTVMHFLNYSWATCSQSMFATYVARAALFLRTRFAVPVVSTHLFCSISGFELVCQLLSLSYWQ